MHDISNDISHIWTRFNLRWLQFGALAGVLAGAFTLALASWVMGDFFYPAKLIGATLLGTEALQNGSLGTGGMVGLGIHLTLSGFFGVVFAQFVWEDSRKRVLFFLGTLAGLAVWLFWSMMFMPSFNEALFFALPKIVSLGLHLFFGFTFGGLLVVSRSVIARPKGPKQSS